METYAPVNRIWPRFMLLALPFVAVAIFLSVQLSRSVGSVSVSSQLATSSTAPGSPPSLPWPKKGAAAVYVEGVGMIGANHDEKPQPIASVTKVMTAYLILKDHPLVQGQAGGNITITQDDVAAYQRDAAQEQSVVAVTAGKQLTEYELLEGLLIASGNNLGEILANWDAGSIQAFVDKMNAEAQALGMKNTHYADASGFSSGSLSTAQDQVLLAVAAMSNPVFAEVVNQVQATLPTAGTIYNVNNQLGKDGIVGVKTGWTEDAGGCFLFAANAQLGTRTFRVYGAVLGQDTLQDAFDASHSLIRTVGPAVQTAKVMTAGQTVATVKAPWSKNIDAQTTQDVEMLVWPGMPVRTAVDVATPKTPIAQGADLGSVTVQVGDQKAQVPVKATGSIQKSSLSWRLFHF